MKTPFRATKEIFDVAKVKSEDEVLTLMRHENVSHCTDSCSDLSFIKLAMENGQKHIIAHSVVQYHLNSKLFGSIPYWNKSGVAFKLFLIFIIGITFPLSSLLHILVPSKCYPSVSGFARKPFVKFISGAASYLVFMSFLILMSIRQRDGVREGKIPTTSELGVLVWIIGSFFRECKQIYESGFRKYFGSGWNWMDLGILVFMLYAYIVWGFIVLKKNGLVGISVERKQHLEW